MKSKVVLVVAVFGLVAVAAVFWIGRKKAPEEPVAAQPAQPVVAVATQAAPPVRVETPAPTEAPKDAPVPGTVQPILGLRQESTAVRWKAVQSLGHNLDSVEVRALFGYLRGHETQSNAAMRGVLKNEVILALKAQVSPPDLVPLLLEMFKDADQDIVIRDYALQHLTTWYDRAKDPAIVQETLWKALEETNCSIAGTALLGLHRLGRSELQLDANRISQAAVEMAANEGVSELARIPAIQVCAERQMKAALPAVLAVAQNSANSMPLRISAVAALGTLGGTDQLALLEGLKTDAGSLMPTAADAALKKLKGRLQK